MASHIVIAACCLFFACAKFEHAYGFAMPLQSITNKQRIGSTQLSAWSIPVPQPNSNPFFPAPSLSEPSSTTWYEDCGSAAIHRNIVYKDDDEQDDYYLWNDYDVGSEERKGYGFARIEAYETYLAYADDHDVATARQSLSSSPKRPSLLRRGVGKLWQRLWR